MAKMIDPDRLAHELERFHFSTGHLVKIQAAMEAATVEVEDVVHCRECVHVGRDGYGLFCHDGRPVKPYGYCNDGDRRDEPTCGEEGCSFG